MTEPDLVGGTRAAYDALAADYAEQFRHELDWYPMDRAVLSAFADHVHATGNTEVADVGSGPGGVTAHLRELELDAYGVDLSPAMVEQAREFHPGIRFEVGSMAALPLPDHHLGGICAWYSTIHLTGRQLAGVCTGFRRVLAPGGYLALAFQSGQGTVRMERALGHRVELDVHLRRPAGVARMLSGLGYDVCMRVLREPESWEKNGRGYIIARSK